ncbi:MAG: hypothetical protein HND43_09510 [Armatimonadetes bacterium]|nr:hypothetical protein [Armatimonadota bacterium]NOG39614.1 hypothetical protein [Armatimonadota bacterium]GIK32550.1 MAG: hypothetical protein BroJett009_15420 [Armatimonadota bacterium]
MAQSDVTLRARLAAAGALILAAAAGAQISGDRQFPQTRSLSLLPGGGVPVSSEGVPGWEGALTLSTPIAYSLRAKEGVYVMGNTNYARWPKLFDARKGEGDSNGSLGLQFGSRMFRGNATFSWMFVDSRLKNVYHIHYSPDLKGRWRLGAGLQDVFGDSNTQIPLDLTNSASAYVVATYEFGGDAFASVGYGGQRFYGYFASASAPIAEGWKAYAEYDTFGINWGVAARLKGLMAGDRPAVLTFGYLKNRWATWTIGAPF